MALCYCTLRVSQLSVGLVVVICLQKCETCFRFLPRVASASCRAAQLIHDILKSFKQLANLRWRKSDLSTEYSKEYTSGVRKTCPVIVQHVWRHRRLTFQMGCVPPTCTTIDDPLPHRGKMGGGTLAEAGRQRVLHAYESCKSLANFVNFTRRVVRLEKAQLFSTISSVKQKVSPRLLF